MKRPLRLPQPLYSTHRDGYRPEIASDGLTIDTPAGPVDLVAVERVLDRRPTPVTKADIRHLVTLLPDGLTEHVEPIAIGLGISLDSVRRAYERHKHTTRTGGGD